ncbi:MAG: class I SAM-dependent methyltransferase [Candidatus Nanopelagicales bacterium]
MPARSGVPLEAWNDLADRYDRQLWLERSAVRAAVDLLAPLPQEQVLDLATGTGEVLRQLASRSARPHAVTAVDQSAGMLARVGALPAGWSTRRADIRALPLADGTFDAAVASYVLHLLADADVPTALAELHRVLRPGGRVATLTPAVPPRGPARTLARRLDALAARNPRRYGGLRAFDVRPALTAAGFTIVRARWNLRGYPTLCVLARCGA